MGSLDDVRTWAVLSAHQLREDGLDQEEAQHVIAGLTIQTPLFKLGPFISLQVSRYFEGKIDLPDEDIEEVTARLFE